MTTSASLPGAIVPFLGKRPNILAGAVATSSTNRFSEIRPEFTPPWKIRLKRSSTPGSPAEREGGVGRVASDAGGGRQRVVDGVPLPARGSALPQHIDRAAVLGMHHNHPAVFGGTAHGAEDRCVVQHEDARIGHEQL